MESRTLLSAAPSPVTGSVTINSSTVTVIPIPAALRKGDFVDIVLRMDSSDANESGENEALTIEELGGQQFLIPTYGQNLPLHFVVPADGAAFDAHFNGSDGDETATIEYSVNKTQYYSNAEKDAASELAMNLSALSFAVGEAGAKSLPAPFGLIAKGVGAALSAITFHENYVVKDPPDALYQVVARPLYPNLKGLLLKNNRAAGAAGSAVIANATLQNLGRQSGVSEALVTTLDRLQSAADAGDSRAVRRQRSASGRFTRLYGRLLTAFSRMLPRLESALVASKVPAISITSSDALAYEQAIAAMGFDADTKALLSQFGLTNDEIAQVQQATVVEDTNAVTGTFPNDLGAPQLVTKLRALGKTMSSYRPPRV